MNKTVVTAIFALTAMFALDATAQEVSLFTGTGYGGTEAKFFVGNHDAADMANHHDMTVKSLKVSKYLRAILYKGENFENYEKGKNYQGGKWGQFEAAAYGFEDLDNIHVPEISSVKVIKDFPSEDVVKTWVGKTWRGNWDWDHDNANTDAAGTTTLTLNEGSVHYSYHNGTVEGDFEIPELVHGGRDSRQPVVTGFTLPDGNILRFEFLTDTEVSAYFWKKGMQAGRTKHKTPQTRAILRMEKLTPKGASTGGEEASATKVPAGALKADITKPGAKISGVGKWEYGFSTKAKPRFNEFMNDDPRFSQQGIKMKNQKSGDWFSIAQNENNEPTKLYNIHYPANSTGEMVLVPGPAEGDETKVRFEANQNATYSFLISARLIEEKGTQEIYGAGVTIYGPDDKPIDNKHLKEHKVPWSKSFDLKLDKGQFVTIAVDYGHKTNKTDHVAVTSSALIKKP